MKPINQLTEQLIGAAIEVHRVKGPGLLINFHDLKLVDGVTRIVNERFVSESSENSVLKDLP